MSDTRVLSVIVPARNAAAHLDRCLRRLSVVGQGKGHRLEVIVVDNGSTDATASIAAQHGARVIHAPGMRVGACRNAGARHAQGDLIGFVDADNEVDAGWAGACVRVLENPAVGLAGYPYRAPASPT